LTIEAHLLIWAGNQISKTVKEPALLDLKEDLLVCVDGEELVFLACDSSPFLDSLAKPLESRRKRLCLKFVPILLFDVCQILCLKICTPDW
jgi:hypothetical protein